AADQARALLETDGARGVHRDVADVRRLEPVGAPDANFLQRNAPERRVPPRRDRVRELRPAARPAPVEVVESELPRERVDAGRERRVADVRLREGEEDVSADRSDVAVQAETLAAPEEVVLLDAGVEEQRVRGAESGPGAERSRLRLLHLD